MATPAREIGGLEAQFAREREGKRGGAQGLLKERLGAWFNGHDDSQSTGKNSDLDYRGQSPEEEEGLALTSGPHLSARAKRKNKWERGCGLEVGCVRARLLGFGPVGPFLLFFCSVSFSNFCFLISFITFVLNIQINSNLFLKFCKINIYYLKC